LAGRVLLGESAEGGVVVAGAEFVQAGVAVEVAGGVLEGVSDGFGFGPAVAALGDQGAGRVPLVERDTKNKPIVRTHPAMKRKIATMRKIESEVSKRRVSEDSNKTAQSVAFTRPTASLGKHRAWM